MLIESSSVSKFRDHSAPGDDVLALLPGRLYAVFDGATDTVGNTVGGMTPGRLAATAAATAMMSHALAADPASRDAHAWLLRMNAGIARALGPARAAGVRAGTTAAMVEDAGGDSLRFLLVGDSGVRINGHELFRMTKDVDLLYAAGRACIYEALQGLGLVGDALELQTRSLVFKGLEHAGQAGLSPGQVRTILDRAEQSCRHRLQADARAGLRQMLVAGIAGGQYGYCNRPGHSLGYAVLDGGQTQGPDVMAFTRSKSSVRSIELFTDGYFSCPDGIRVSDWENEFARVEALDFHKLHAYAGVKGSTSTLFSDDRSVLVVQF